MAFTNKFKLLLYPTMLSILFLAGFALAFPFKSSTATRYQGSEHLLEKSQHDVNSMLTSSELLLEHQVLRRGLSKNISNGSNKTPELYYIRQDEVNTPEKKMRAIAHYEDVLHRKEQDRQRHKKEYIKHHDVLSSGDHDRIYRELGLPRWGNHGVEENHKFFQKKDKEFELQISKLRHDLKELNY